MGFFSGAKKVVKPLVNVPQWLGYDVLKNMTKWVGGLFKQFFIPQHAEVTETFEQAMARLNLTEADIKERIQQFKFLMILWVIVFVGVFGYSVYLAWIGSMRGFIVGLSVGFLALSQVFRNHFWIFQLRHRKLGCSLREWWDSKVTTEAPK